MSRYHEKLAEVPATDRHIVEWEARFLANTGWRPSDAVTEAVTRLQEGRIRSITANKIIEFEKAQGVRA